METAKKIGICMDAASAHVIRFLMEPSEIVTVKSEFTKEEEENAMRKGESHMHNKEQHMQKEYYKELGDIILNYNEVILFGPTNAKAELFNLLKEDNRFSKIKIEMKETDKMNHDQQLSYVQSYFSNTRPTA
ncbi:hypothetical protein [Flavobacterium suncheonense]|uniref:Host attachment protein n=1 Tax=Flavobacterium suncheonense GH29-5 = DSM 17707 TaxID=1121899 RepID=A0A0A2M6I7_9FLAO|nr:hypothetical protein [Flavobacterium suncheonense]KGO87899.1 hypothetical protein Q764_12170 [Flavobacterium suncheonense GH29-5 = DSM 17707]